MAGEAKPVEGADHPVEEMTYEPAYHELEGIVAALETQELSLEDSLALYERGRALASRCAALLETAELKIRELSG